jgi:hypothetical protein
LGARPDRLIRGPAGAARLSVESDEAVRSELTEALGP